MSLNNPEATQQALNILRSGSTFQWYVIPLLVIVIYIYANEIEKGNYRVIAGGLALYMVHWFVEIVNALIQHFWVMLCGQYLPEQPLKSWWVSESKLI